MKMVKYVCENCHYVFEVEDKKMFVECPQCGDGEVEKVDDVVKNLTEYEASQE